MSSDGQKLVFVVGGGDLEALGRLGTAPALQALALVLKCRLESLKVNLGWDLEMETS